MIVTILLIIVVVKKIMKFKLASVTKEQVILTNGFGSEYFPPMQSLWCFYYYLCFKRAHSTIERIKFMLTKKLTLFDSLIAYINGQSSMNALKQFFINKSKTIRNVKLLSLICLLIFVFFLVHHKLLLRFVYGLLFFVLLDKFHK